MIPKYKTIFSLRVRVALQQLGFMPLFEQENKLKEGFKCWTYLNTPDFEKALGKILRGEYNG